MGLGGATVPIMRSLNDVLNMRCEGSVSKFSHYITSASISKFCFTKSLVPTYSYLKTRKRKSYVYTFLMKLSLLLI